MSSANDYKSHFKALAAFVLGELRSDEQVTINYNAETSYFMRFNNAKIRQSGTVEQSGISLKLFCNKKSWSFSLGLSGTLADDENLIAKAIGEARATLPLLPEDEYQAIPTASDTSEANYDGKLLNEQEIPAKVLEPASGMDFTGLYSQGVICRGAANSAGAKHWFATHTFVVDYSAWLPNGKGVKSSYAGRDWSDQEYAVKIKMTRDSLANLTKPETVLKPGSYRAFITADALNEVVTFFSWNGFGERGIRQGDSAYLALREGRESFSAKFGLTQDFNLGVEPAFNDDGESAPTTLRVIDQGKLVNTLINSRTAKQYSIASNAADDGEDMRSVAMDAGELPEAEALKALGTGIYVSNFHYLNWSDPATARITGMTRFACLWVENGQIVGPIKDMRWDESLYAMLGSKLEALTKERHLQVETMTYEMRAVGGSLLPGILVDGLSFTL
jgi:predicted Zn-dependent protease